MDRRHFLNWIARRGAAASVGLAFGQKLLSVSQPIADASPDPGLDSNAHARKLIIPTDTPDRFNAKVMEFNPVPAPDPATWRLEIIGMVERPAKLKLADLKALPQITQSSRLKCVQCWSARIRWQGFRSNELLRIARPRPKATWVRIDCADLYYDYVKLDELTHPRVLFGLGMNGEPLTPEHGAPLRLVMPFKYGYKSSKLITKITFMDHGGRGVVADTWPYYSLTGDIEPGYDHPFDFPGVTRKIKGGEILDY